MPAPAPLGTGPETVDRAAADLQVPARDAADEAGTGPVRPSVHPGAAGTPACAASASVTVSVIIPAYNAAPQIGRAIESALAQTHAPLEILVVDDGSRDRTAEIVGRLPPPVRLIRKENGGPATARNLGAREARGEWLALLDADDWWFPDKLRAQLACVTDESVGLVHCLPDHRNDALPPA
jgi:cellulose synthase/poly-beta-1,6-N-acetylglucosamine synthase-like glycosyltransferase